MLLQHIFLLAQKQKLSSDEISDKLEKESAELQSVRDLLPKTRMELYTLVGIIVTFLAFISTVGFNPFD